MNRYSSYTLDDLRLTTIGLYAGLVTTVPEPVGADGTSDAILSTEDTINADAELSEATDELVLTYWAPGWPILNLMILDPIAVGTAILHFGLDLLNGIYAYANAFGEWIDNIIDVAGDKADFIIEIVTEILETVFEYVVIRWALTFAVAGWVLVDTVKLFDVSMTVLLASIAAASSLTALFVGFAYASAILAAEIHSLAEAGTIWLIVLIQILLLLGQWFWRGLDPNGVASTVIRISKWTSSLFGPFPEIILLFCWWSWATLIFLLGMIALSIANIAYLFMIS